MDLASSDASAGLRDRDATDATRRVVAAAEALFGVRGGGGSGGWGSGLASCWAAAAVPGPFARAALVSDQVASGQRRAAREGVRAAFLRSGRHSDMPEDQQHA